MDVCTSIGTHTIGGGEGTTFLTFIADHSRLTVIYLLSHKNYVYDKLKDYVAMLKTQFGRFPKTIRSDNGEEYTGKETEEYLRGKRYPTTFYSTILSKPKRHSRKKE